MNEEIIENIKDYCRQLKLGTNIVKNIYTIQANSHEEFLVKILEVEIKHRETVRKNRYLKQAGFDVVKTFENYTFDQIEVPASIGIDDLKSAAFVRRKENLILYGPVGTGKTHLAIAIGVAACMSSIKVKFYRTAALVNELIDAKNNGTLKKILKQIEQADLLICDEWGYIPIDIDGAKLLYQVLAGCYEKKSIILTTNLEFSKWNSIFFDEKLTNAIIDRMVHHSHLLVFNGPSYRLQNSLMKYN
ncbi:IS21-like element helper ATPase IstB [Thermoanaerobacterium thermosaccharolyticum]|uniref:DNA replication protein n=1 Tax=Thermoanaerobacterium thermosaccharolyticum M0795 TaxID=698948 RepID=L0IMI8_THETR|nr:IS21-like element helper ATPase IstB [Thermoanaerobacterium thermosaccharolyticum]AGB19974.1 DNA replication protein [Thermoanaerobacterium thermosaccharolyticum M0795]